MNSKKKLEIDDVFCIACRSIYLRPVTMPCNHTLCLDCFKSMVNITAYQCPMCRKRISNWLRKYKHNWDALVNEKLWEEVQLQFPVEVQKRLNDEDDGLEEIIVGRGFVRVELKEGEIKKEFDSMMMNLQQEQEEIELQNLQLAKKLQEEEENKRKTHKLVQEKIIQEDVKLASVLQIKIEQDIEQEMLLNESDQEFAKQLQVQMESEYNQIKIAEKIKLPTPKTKLPGKGPLDDIFSKLRKKSKEQCNLKNDTPSCSYSSSYSSSSNCSSLTSHSSTSLSNSSINYISTVKNEQFKDNILDACTCGRLSDWHSNISPCKFCADQISEYEKLMIQQKNDYLMAKKLEDSFHRENFEDYNLRKRPNPTQGGGHKKKVMKVSKGQQTDNRQQTLKQMLKKI